jgi:NTP pyrophosphatase (non-canonical NTP hydrolase)
LKWYKAIKKPIVIEYREVEPRTYYWDRKEQKWKQGELIETREGILYAESGKDYIIRGIKGEIYPIDKNIFSLTYEVIKDLSLKEKMNQIRKLVEIKGHGSKLKDIPFKLLFAINEICEAVDNWKKNEYENVNEIAEELIDAIFYILDAYGILYREFDIIDPDNMFYKKLEKNYKRPYRYGRSDKKKEFYTDYKYNFDIPYSC